MNLKAQLIRLGLWAHTRRMPLWPLGEAPVAVPSRYRTLGLKQLVEEDLLGSLVRLYQLVFGSNERDRRTGEVVWGEGGICQNCGKLLPLHEFESRLRSQDTSCDCGGMFVYFHPEGLLRRRLQEELSDIDGVPICILVSETVEGAGESLPLAGAAWGTVASAGTIVVRIWRGRFNGGPQYAPQMSALVARLWTLGYTDPRPLLFADEFFVHRQARGGLGPPAMLTRLLFEHAIQNGTTAALFWTNPRSPIYTLAMMMGFEPVFRIEDLIFLFNPDVRPIVKLTQNQSPKEIGYLLHRISKLTGIGRR